MGSLGDALHLGEWIQIHGNCKARSFEILELVLSTKFKKST